MQSFLVLSWGGVALLAGPHEGIYPLIKFVQGQSYPCKSSLYHKMLDQSDHLYEQQVTFFMCRGLQGQGENTSNMTRYMKNNMQEHALQIGYSNSLIFPHH